MHSAPAPCYTATHPFPAHLHSSQKWLRTGKLFSCVLDVCGRFFIALGGLFDSCACSDGLLLRSRDSQDDLVVLTGRLRRVQGLRCIVSVCIVVFPPKIGSFPHSVLYGSWRKLYLESSSSSGF